MKAIIILDCDVDTPEELDDLVTGVRRTMGGVIRIATGDVAEQILGTFVIEGKEDEWARRQRKR